MNDTCRYIASGDSIPLPLSLQFSLLLRDPTAIGVERSVRGDQRGREGGRDGEGARIIIWDSSTLCAVESIQIPLSTATGNRYTTLHYTTLHYTTLHYTTLHYTTLHYTTLHYTTLHYTTLHYTTHFLILPSCTSPV
jgi:hypothetical protein